MDNLGTVALIYDVQNGFLLGTSVLTPSPQLSRNRSLTERADNTKLILGDYLRFIDTFPSVQIRV